MFNALFTTRELSDNFAYNTFKSLNEVSLEIYNQRQKKLKELPEFGPMAWLLSDHSRRALQRSAHEQWWYNFVEETISSTKLEDMSPNFVGSNAHWLLNMIMRNRLNSLYASKIESWKHITRSPMWYIPGWVSKAMDNGLDAMVLNAIHRHWGTELNMIINVGTSLFHEGWAELSLESGDAGYTVDHLPFRIPYKDPDECNVYWRDVLWAIYTVGDNSGFDNVDPEILKSLDDFNHHWAVKSRDN